MTRIAVIGDIHGNLPALHAVVEDIARRGVDVVVNLGDHASGPLWPQETVAFLMQQEWLQIAGNCDRQLVQQAPANHGASDRFAFERLTIEQRRWLMRLPTTGSLSDDVLLFHGTPSDDSAYLLEVVAHRQVRLVRHSELLQRLGGVAAQVMLCGHSHLPRIVRISGTLIINPGSIGLPAYEHSQPEPHAMETGAPDARYAVLEQFHHGWQGLLVAVPYDHHAAVEQARRNARPDWACGLLTGYVIT